jgi:DNA repair exonuclease SbcCD nuclease subunit
MGDLMHIKILHAADFHLDSPFDSLSDEKARERRREQRELFMSLAELCEKERVQVVLLPGDLLDSERSGYETSELLTEVLGKIKAEVFIAPGNHDFISPLSPYSLLTFSDNVHIFKTSEITKLSFPEKGFTVWGAGFKNNSSPPLLAGASLKREAGVNLMILHGDLNMPKSVYNPITEAEIAASEMDYLALGHVHAFGGFQKSGKTSYAYSGCPEGRGFDETGEKGVIIGNVGEDKCDLSFLPLGGRKYETLTIDLSGKTDAAAALLEALPRDSARDIYKIIFQGEFDGDLGINRLQEAVAERLYAVSIRDNTRIRRDIWAQAEEDTLKGLFLRSLRKKYETAKTDEEREKTILAVRYGLSALENGEEYRT